MGWGTLPPWPWPSSLLWDLCSHHPLQPPSPSQDGSNRESAGAASQEICVCVCVVTSVEPGVCMAVRGCVCMPGCPPVVLHQPLPQSCGDPLVSVPTLSLGLAGGCDELRAADWASLQRWGTGGCFPGSGLRGLQPRPPLGQREAELPVLPACGHKGALGPSFPPFLWSCSDSQQGRHPELFWECGPSSCSCH